MQDYGPSTYGDAIADTYDAWYGDHPSTAAAVETISRLAAARPAEPILELGIGSGRLALPLAARGFAVWGLAASSAMVDQLRAKPGGDAIPVAITDMAAIDLSAIDPDGGTRFGVVFVAINTFFNLTSADAQRACMQRVAALLAPEGVFALEAFVPDVDRPMSAVEARTVERDHVVLTASRADPDTQIVRVQMIEIRESGITMRPLVIRYASPDELDAMAEAAGLELQERWRDWSATPFEPGDATQVSVYRRKRH